MGRKATSNQPTIKTPAQMLMLSKVKLLAKAVKENVPSRSADFPMYSIQLNNCKLILERNIKAQEPMWQETSNFIKDTISRTNKILRSHKQAAKNAVAATKRNLKTI